MKDQDIRQCFISHCSGDRKLHKTLGDIVYGGFDSGRYKFFHSSQKEFNAVAGMGLSAQLREALNDSDVMIALITDNYLRSQICLTELSSFWFMDKPVIALAYCEEGIKFIKNLMGEGFIYIDATSEERDPEDLAQRMITALGNCGFRPLDKKTAAAAFEGFFRDADQAEPSRGYIGSGEVFGNINKYCAEAGIRRVTNVNLSDNDLLEKLEDCRRIYIVSTTGRNLISKLSADFIPAMLAKGTDFYVIIPDRASDFISDVAEVEDPQNKERSRHRFSDEFGNVLTDLQEALGRSRYEYPEGKGEIFFGCASNLLRQTVTMGVHEDGSVWGWLSVTMPPKRTIGNTPSIEFEGGTRGAGFAATAYYHVTSMYRFAVRRGEVIRISESVGFTGWEKEEAAGTAGTAGMLTETVRDAEKYWQDRYDKARVNMASRGGDLELIEVAAQHPLRSNGKPGREFAKRLDLAAELYHKLMEQGSDVKIYVPGSLHVHDGKADKCALSDAGVRYLKAKQIPEEDLLGNEMNVLYKGDAGVYNTADECYVAARIFNDGEFRRLHCICSPNQLMRKKLFYIAFGVIPYYYTVNIDALAHDDIYEFFHGVPDVLFNDHTWQGEDSENGNRTRRDRMPGLAKIRK